ncbi:hypothetical protein [Alkalihalobacillus deserti]|uniref:hypothetical protein n=1 Tax=Alkalihalobacillus deserti TaxID=2879466 RepID=UPI001D13A5C6|nr:hypothetical protein [Alkalihalobacillus deserti]
MIQQIESDRITQKEFDESTLKPYIKTGARLHENTIELPIWDDQQIFKGAFPPWGFHKFCDYQKSEFGLGLVHVQFRYGKKIRKRSDYRFREEKDVEAIDFYFLYDFDKGHYIEVKPENNDDWKKRIFDMETLENETFTFIWDYLVNRRPQIIELNVNFKKIERKTYLIIKKHLNLVEDFLGDTRFYFDLLFIIYGDLTQEEHYYLEQSIRRFKKQVIITLEYMQQYEDNQPFDVHRDYANRLDTKSSFGIITETLFMFDNLLRERKEKIDNDEWFVYNPRQGYIRVDKKNKKLYPNLSEIERRRSLYSHAANLESENILNNEIVSRVKK